ncbi:Secreted RxLR effector protein [Sesamum angolense]|uniref:Secreted RxLR effector protein n=1 Tax=Sesamum angolense TaxID=2727404 RepID=A0AAE2C099_9LAMI|nr:Secreted RxLR effector protein [Sesamum angolense]
MQLMDVVTAYLYGSLDTDIYMRIPKGLKMPEALKSKPCDMYSIKLKSCSLDVNKDPFRPPAHNDEILRSEVPYLSAIGALMYLANNTRPDIAFSIILLARYNSTPTKRHWNGVKHILRYLRGTNDMGLYFERHEDAKANNLVGYSDAGYLSDSHKPISQSGYVFMYGGTAIS